MAMACTAVGDVIYVDDDASLGGNGQNWATPYRHLERCYGLFGHQRVLLGIGCGRYVWQNQRWHRDTDRPGSHVHLHIRNFKVQCCD